MALRPVQKTLPSEAFLGFVSIVRNGTEVTDAAQLWRDANDVLSYIGYLGFGDPDVLPPPPAPTPPPASQLFASAPVTLSLTHESKEAALQTLEAMAKGEVSATAGAFDWVSLIKTILAIVIKVLPLVLP